MAPPNAVEARGLDEGGSMREAREHAGMLGGYSPGNPVKSRVLESMSMHGVAVWYMRRLKAATDSGDKSKKASDAAMPRLGALSPISRGGRSTSPSSPKRSSPGWNVEVGSPRASQDPRSAKTESGKAEERAGEAAVYFLHEAFATIGGELSERKRRGDSCPPGEAVELPSASRRRRNELRAEFAAHEEKELESLRSALRRREAELTQLRYHRYKLQQRLEDRRARLAAAREAAREGRIAERNGPADVISMPGTPAKSGTISKQGSMKTGQEFSRGAAAAAMNRILAGDRDERHRGNRKRGGSRDEMQEKHADAEWTEVLYADAEVEHEREKQLADRQRELNRIIQMRRAREAQLMTAEARNMQLDAQARRLESRSRMLARDFRNVHLKMLTMVEDQIVQTTDQQGSRASELSSLRKRHYLEFCKYLPSEDLVEMAAGIQERVDKELVCFEDLEEKLKESEAPLAKIHHLTSALARGIHGFSETCEHFKEENLHCLQRRLVNMDNISKATVMATEAEVLAYSIDALCGKLCTHASQDQPTRPPAEEVRRMTVK
eukprot:TRINITY_DN64325_c0_g1_i1.p1 TRINITY_DN64325_c0_g1~~TRINITY_DN64325_c0_g1_i1.p1  ORF type:complete len:553 (-),score=115.86 TRINITY_DN64325_c0_g1_i1:168-1826(-)